MQELRGERLLTCAAQQEGRAEQGERCDLVNMLHSASQALGSTSFVILLIFPDKGMI